jgi:hypothetical protein
MMNLKGREMRQSFAFLKHQSRKRPEGYLRSPQYNNRLQDPDLNPRPSNTKRDFLPL